jgi:hypothetical protein
MKRRLVGLRLDRNSRQIGGQLLNDLRQFIENSDLCPGRIVSDFGDFLAVLRSILESLLQMNSA